MAKHKFEHIEHLVSNVDEVRRLGEIHSQITTTGPGYKHNVQVLHKGAIVLLVAGWESFVEELATNTFDFLLDKSKDPSIFPKKVLALAGRPLRECDDETEVWKLAGDKWRDVLIEHRDQLLDRHIGKLHSPKPDNVDDLFRNLACIIHEPVA